MHLHAVTRQEHIRAISTNNPSVAMRVIGVRTGGTGIPSQRAVVLLHEIGGARRLSMRVGAWEGEQILWYVSTTPMARPPLFDWFAALLQQAGAVVRHVTLTNLTDEVLYALLAVEIAGQSRHVDARPADGILLALASGTPIFANPMTLSSENDRLGQ